MGSKQGSRVLVRLAAMRVKLPRATFKVAAILVLSVALASPAIPAVAAGPTLCATPSPTTFQGTITNADRLAAAERAAAARAACTVALQKASPAVAGGTLATPDYFGTTPNYANSPLPTAGAAVTFSGGGGTGASATATTTGGAVTGVTVAKGGSGYSSAPSVSFSGGSGTGATATAVLTPSVGSITMTNAGTGYTSPPTVSITDVGGGTGAAAVAAISGRVTGFTVTNPGVGYTSVPTVTLSGGGEGKGATATATLGVGAVAVTGGVGNASPTVGFSGGGATAGATATAVSGITSITINNGGASYVTAPTVTITGGGATTDATATATVAGGVITALTVTSHGSGYTSAPITVAFAGGGGSGAVATAVVAIIVTITSPGAGYTSVPTVNIGGGGGLAFPIATLAVVGLNVTTGGSGYASAPTVTIVGGGATTVATATAILTADAIFAITVTNGGTGYVSPVVNITGGGGSGATATAALSNAVGSVTLGSGGAGYTTGGIRKFVDELPGLGRTGSNLLGQYLSVAVPDTTTYPGSDYYEIGLIQYRQKLSSDLPATLLRGYVQLETNVMNVAAGSLHIQLSNANLDGTTTDIAGVFGFDMPQYLGTTIIAQKDRPVRVKFTNLLPTGSGGDLFIPVDTTVMGAGAGPVDLAGNPCDPDTQTTCAPYAQNRATLHLHGGVTPWISDGTPNQWITPIGQVTKYPKGVSVTNVPDMPDPGPGSETFFYTNQQSARLMFYHDHSYGLTRLNVYAGEAAGYLLDDPTEQALVTNGVVPADEIPLIIQDKTFVPGSAQLAAEDPTWNTAKYGNTGNLWFPHVYMPNQNPSDAMGVNPMGRWDYGPWFWPPYTGLTNGAVANPLNGTTPDEGPTIPGVPNPSITPEGFMDTPLVNGTAYPYLTVGQKAYRFRILNASNDRTWNLQLYCASSTGQMWDSSGHLVNPGAGEVTMVPAITGTPGTDGYTTDQTDGRAGGVPDVRTGGPKMIQIGTEGGVLPNAVTLPNSPIGYEYNRRSITVTNVSNKNLMLGPAERADVIVDFSQVNLATCSNIILYNDSPAPVPAFDPRYDYYTGDPDQTSTGGAPTTLPGYGPNTRTIMQIRVDPSKGVSTTAFNAAALTTAIPAAFAQSQDPIIVPESAYNAAYGTTAVDNYVRIQDTTATFAPYSPTTKVPQTASPTTIALQPKAIQELFDPMYGRMNATLGVELPNTTGVNQTTLPMGYAEPYTEAISAGDIATQVGALGDSTQIWKITHNGVDTHFIHFHLFNVQIINRVGWDGMIKPPDPNELGWKDTVRMNPLEDTIVALRPIEPKVPFGVPDSIRSIDVTRPVTAMIASFDPLTGNATSTPNTPVNYGWEYVWHCHILGHEENDMMRPVVFNAPRAAVTAPVLSVASATGSPNLYLSWTDATPPATPYGQAGTSWGAPDGEIGYRIERHVGGGASGFQQIGTALANQTNFVDTSPGVTTNSYRVIAYNVVGDSPSGSVDASVAATPPGQPLGVSASVTSATSATVTWSPPASSATTIDGRSPITGYTVTSSPGGITCSASASPCLVTGLTTGVGYTFTVKATNGSTGPASVPSNAVVPGVVPPAPTVVNAAPGPGSAYVTWAAPARPSTPISPIIDYTVTSSPAGGTCTATTAAGALGCKVTGLTNGTSYTFTVTARNATGSSAASAASNAVFPAATPDAPTNVTVTPGSGQALVSWLAPAHTDLTISGYTVTSSPGGLTCSTTLLSCTIVGLNNGTTYSFSVGALVQVTAPSMVPYGMTALSAPTGASTPASVPDAPAVVIATAGNAAAAVAWTAPANTGGFPITGYTVTASGSGGQGCTTTGATTCIVANLVNGVAYTFTVTATTSFGTSSPSAPSPAVTPTGVPTPPTSVAAVPGDASALVSWSANSGSILNYTVTSSPGNFTCTTSSSLSCTVTGLTNGTSYTFTVIATSLVGPSLPSVPSSPVIPATVPGAPAGVGAAALNGSASVSWLAPASNGGLAITGYTVTSSPGSFTCSTTLSTCVVAGLTNGTAYTFTVTAANGVGTGPASAPSAAVTPLAGASYFAVTPNRIADSRPATHLGLNTLTSGTAKTFQVTGLVPSDASRNIPAGAVAITGNLTVVNATSQGFVSLTTTAINSPTTSTINFPARDIRANGVTIALGSGGTLSVAFVGTRGATADVVLDVTGYFANVTSGSTYFAVTPNRIADSRPATHLGLTTLVSGTAKTFQVTGLAPSDASRNIPAGAVAITGNLTAVNATSQGFVSLTTTPINSPTTSTINFPTRDIRANGVTIALGSGGTLGVTFVGTRGATADVVLDVTGYFMAGYSGASYVPVTPNRIADSRPATHLGLTTLVSGTAKQFQVTGVAPSDASRNIPAGAVAITGNLTAVNGTSQGFVSLTTTPINSPTTSTINFPIRDIRANGVTIALGSGGTLGVTFVGTGGATADVLLDVTGYFIP